MALTALLCGTGLATAQGGSNYSALGIGDLRTTVGGIYDGMAGTAIAMPTPYGINVVNPALVGLATTTRLQGGYRFNQHVINNPDGRVMAQNNGEIDGLVAMFSVDTTHGFGITFGILPFSNVAYSVQRNLQSVIDTDTITGRSEQKGSGGSSMLHLGSSVRLFDRLHLGIAVNGLFGVMSYEDNVYANGPYNTVQSSQSYDLRGWMFKGGLMWRATDWLNLGAYVMSGPDAAVYITRRAAGIQFTGVYYDSTQIEQTKSGMPLLYGFGVSTPVGEGYLGADVEFRDFTALTVNVRDDAGYTTGLRTSLGYTQPGLNTGTFWKKIGFHTGVSMQQLYTTFQGQNLWEFFGTGGMSMPLGGNAMVDAGLQLGYRGVTDSQGTLNEFVGRLTVSVSIGETWFQPFRRD